MGFRFGERKYGEGLYSRWPDDWRDQPPVPPPFWQVKACEPKIWAPPTQPPPAWTPLVRKTAWRPTR